MNDIDFLGLKGEFLLRQNHNIIRPIKVIIGDTTNATKKYKWTLINNCTDESQNRTCMTLRLEVYSKFFFLTWHQKHLFNNDNSILQPYWLYLIKWCRLHGFYCILYLLKDWKFIPKTIYSIITKNKWIYDCFV